MNRWTQDLNLSLTSKEPFLEPPPGEVPSVLPTRRGARNKPRPEAQEERRIHHSILPSSPCEGGRGHVHPARA